MINLLYCGNDAIYKGLCMSLISIANHCDEELNVYLLTMDLTSMNEKYKPIKKEMLVNLEKYLQTKNANSSIKIIDCTNLFLELNKDSVNMQSRYSPYAFLRLVADEVEGLPDKILYLDTDIVARKDIKPLYDIDISNYEYGAVKDYYGKVFINKNYINSGVLLLNMTKIRETKLFAKTRKATNNKKMLFPDQTALNKYATKKLILPSIYNSQRKCREKDVLRHFCKSIRWYPYLFETKKKKEYGNEFMFKWFRLFHLINVKPWNQLAMHKKLKCHHFDDVYETMINLDKFKGEN